MVVDSGKTQDRLAGHREKDSLVGQVLCQGVCVEDSGKNQLNCSQLVSRGKGSLNTCEDVEANPGPGR